MPLERLLSVAALTPGQACLLAAQLLQATHRPDEPDHPPTSSVGLGPVTVTACGTLEVGRPGGHPGTSADELLAQVLRTARRLPTHPTPDQLALLHRLEDAVAASSLEADVRAHMLRTAVADTSGPGAEARLTGQIGQLVEACVHLDGGARPPEPGVPRRPSALAPSRPSRRRRTGVRHRMPRRRAALVALVALAVLAAGAGYAVLRGAGDLTSALGLGDGTTKSHAAHPAQQRRAAAHARAHRQVLGLAPRHAGAVRNVALRRAGACRPGARCPVEVTVHLRASSTTRSVSWRVGAARWCKRGRSWSPATTVTARPGRTTVHATSSARVPRGRSLALVALTSAPARAQSRPVPATGSALRC